MYLDLREIRIAGRSVRIPGDKDKYPQRRTRRCSSWKTTQGEAGIGTRYRGRADAAVVRGEILSQIRDSSHGLPGGGF
jgi:hypothetical protein